MFSCYLDGAAATTYLFRGMAVRFPIDPFDILTDHFPTLEADGVSRVTRYDAAFFE
jgi:hypothetical protein